MKDAQIISNKEKSAAGQEVKKNVREILQGLLTDNLIIGFESEVNYSHIDFIYEKQFKCDFIVETLDNKYILIRASNSYRSDRAKIAFYDLLGIQKYSKFSGDIVASILLFPNSEENDSSFISTRQKVINNEFYSPASHWLTFSELKEFFDNYRYEITIPMERRYESNFDSYLNEHMEVSEQNGSYYGKSGYKLEKFLVEIINRYNNLINYKNGDDIFGEYKIILDSITSTKNINKNKILQIKATDSILKLKNGGSAKTDIFIEIATEEKTYTASISVKNSTNNSVSCHDYQAKDFIRVIAPTDSEFRTFIETFQKAGSWEAYNNELENLEIDIDTSNIINRHMIKIIEWAITGKHDSENLINPEMQIVDFIFTRDAKTNTCYMYSSSSYINELIARIGTQTGAPFSWTYPSKQRGKRIQLKMPLKIE